MDDLSYEPSLLVQETLYWDEVEEQDDGIPRRYGTVKTMPGVRSEGLSQDELRQPRLEVLRGDVRWIEYEGE